MSRGVCGTKLDGTYPGTMETELQCNGPRKESTVHIACEEILSDHWAGKGRGLDALALEYQREYGSAWRNLDMSDFVNKAPPNSPVGIFSLRFEEQGRDLGFG
jgi:hypothetical protein